MIHVRLGEDPRRPWATHDGVSARGYAVCGDELQEGPAFAAGAANRHSGSEARLIAPRFNDLNGSFSLVWQNPHRVEAAVDRVRSMPLFYGARGSDFYLSDDAEWVRRRVGDESIDNLAATEFLMTGYVTGSDTLYPNIKQLQAGEHLLVDDAMSGIRLKTDRYAEFSPASRDPGRETAELHREFDGVLVGAFERLVRSVSGRPLLVPLSGGFDSRLVALMLKRLGRADVTCFSYGREGNRESEVSRALARALGYRWEFVEYTPARWYEWFRSEERAAYYAFADGLCSIPHLQDWPAVWELKRRGLVGDDAVFVPGHTGDFIAGGHLPDALTKFRRFDADRVVEWIEQKHYALNGANVVGKEAVVEMRRRLRRRFEGMAIESTEEAARAYEWWEWQERQAKFICNAVRAYEFWGFDWRLPLWDAEVMRFWEGVPLVHRVGKPLYNSYVCQMGDHLRVPPPNAEPWGRSVLRHVLNAQPLLGLRATVQSSLNTVFARRQYANHFLGWFGVMMEDVFRTHYSGREHLNSFLTRERIGRLAF